jgi:hypothetical protein
MPLNLSITIIKKNKNKRKLILFINLLKVFKARLKKNKKYNTLTYIKF